MAVRRLASSFLLFLLIALSTVAAQRPRTTPRRSQPQYPNVIVITLDTTRADRMGFVGSLILDPLDGTAPGFDRGFDVYDASFRLRRHGADRYKTVERRAEVVVSHALGWLSQVANKPVFLWVHLYDAHDPYDPPSPY